MKALLFMTSILFSLATFGGSSVQLFGTDSFNERNLTVSHIKITRLSKSKFKVEACQKMAHQKGLSPLKCQIIKNEISYTQISKIHNGLEKPQSQNYIATSQNGGLYLKKYEKKSSGWLGLIKGSKDSAPVATVYSGGTGVLLALIEVHFLGQRKHITINPEDTKKVVSFSDKTLFVAAPVTSILSEIQSQLR